MDGASNRAMLKAGHPLLVRACHKLSSAGLTLSLSLYRDCHTTEGSSNALQGKARRCQSF